MFDSSELKQVTRPIRKFLDNPELLDLCVNRPGEVFLSLPSGWKRETADNITVDWIRTFIKSSTVYSSQITNKTSPVLSTTLFSGERLQAVLPPAAKHPCITIRRPSDKLFSLKELESQGAFTVDPSNGKKDKTAVKEARDIYLSGNIRKFFEFSVKKKLNIVISGATGSGKTTVTKALIQEIPDDERIITIEDAEELELRQPNVVKLFYARSLDNDKIKSVTPKDLLVSCLRMKPDRVLLSEIRDEEAYYYLRNVNSGHPGTITSIHANSPRQAIEQFSLMIKQSQAGAGMPRQDIVALVGELVDVVVQTANWKVTDIFFPGLEKM